MSATIGREPSAFVLTPRSWAALIVVGALLVFVFATPISFLLRTWNNNEAYGYGFLVPAISAFLIWQRKNQLAEIPFRGSWTGVAATLFGVVLFLLGELSTIWSIGQYGLVMAILGIALAFVGWRAFRSLFIPLAFLFFAIPLPPFINKALSLEMQLMSSELGVALVRLFGISVHLEGNVIDLGTYKLQVVEACSGLNYLFPLATLSFLIAYLMRAAFWKRAVVFLSSVPITILMNSFRIGMIGVLVEYWGAGQAEGFLHYFEGWVIFMACLAILLAEVWLLSRIGKDRGTLRDALAFDLPAPTPASRAHRPRRAGAAFWSAGGLVLAAALATPWLQAREEMTPARASLDEFPLAFAGWRGQRDRLDPIYLDALKLDEYLLANYTDGDYAPVNLYVAYYGSQRSGEAAHSPRSCIPGGGWKIQSLETHVVDAAQPGAHPLEVNRLLIQFGDEKQLVYYWFQQRGRQLTNEFAVKWYIFWDALTRSRTDGALVRLITPVGSSEDIARADARMARFAREVAPRLAQYVPD